MTLTQVRQDLAVYARLGGDASIPVALAELRVVLGALNEAEEAFAKLTSNCFDGGERYRIAEDALAKLRD